MMKVDCISEYGQERYDEGLNTGRTEGLNTGRTEGEIKW